MPDQMTSKGQRALVRRMQKAGRPTRVTKTDDPAFPIQLEYLNKIDGKWTRITLVLSQRTIHKIIRTLRTK